uniref:Cadherin domain-containing protein n=1 Tax=Amphimedon queenslandica TaxID=400682 RepID=A0A1X7VA24_AMPQE
MKVLSFLLLCFIASTQCQVEIDGPSVVNAHVFENSNAGTQVVDFHVAGESSVTWSLNSTSNFTINSQGVVSVGDVLDREATLAPHVITLTVTAAANASNDSVVLVITILDRNDNAPIFENPTSNGTHDLITLLESEPVGGIVYTILASDPDFSSAGNFHFVLTNPDGYFLVGYLTGDIELHKKLDYETQTTHTLNIQIQDEGQPSLSTAITITVNVTNDEESACVFGQKFYYSTIPEGHYSSMTPSTITTVSATASTGTVRYSLTTNPSSLFSIGTTNGIVTLAGSIDRETISRYIVSISGQEYLSSGVMADSPPCYATIVLTVSDINDNSPTFFSGTYSGTVNENIELGHIVIATISAFDLDLGTNAAFMYKIRDRAIGADNKFQIHPTTGVINVTGELDYESLSDPNYQFTIEAFEPASVSNPKSGTATVTVHVNDVNDHTPYFHASNYSFTLYEEQPLTSFTPLLTASDDDATSLYNTLSFSLNGYGAVQPNLHFTLNSAPGSNNAQLSTLTMLDRESVSSYHMIATVSDNGASPLTDTADIFVTVMDINDHPPVFDLPGYSVEIAEENTYSSCLTVHAEDTIDEDGPNTQVSYSFIVHSASPNTSIAGLQTKFILDSGNGQMSCLAINHEYGYHNIILQVTASDAGTNPGPLNSTVFVNVTIEDINEHPPVFTQATYNSTVYENHTIGSEIGITVLATESGDTGLNDPPTYSIISGNVNGAFSLDENTGVFTLAHSLDWETLAPNPIAIKVRAIDRHDQGDRVFSSTAMVMVTVLDVNDNTPYITQPLGHPTITVSEGGPPQIITTILATDPDGASDGSVTYDMVNPSYGNFTINPVTGTVFMHTPPDRETISSFSITLIASDQPPDPSTARTNSTYINIAVTDINDHPPVFVNNTNLFVTIPEDTSGAVSLLTVTAVDNYDIGVNAEIEYFIESISPTFISPGGNAKFQIDQTTGVLQTGSVGFDYEDSTDRLYTVIIVARDKGTNPMRLTDTATVTVTITDVNDNPPVLSASFFDHTITENYGTTLTQSDQVLITGINVSDVDTVSTSFQYSVVDPLKTLGLFNVDPNTGDIYVPSGTHIDREDTDNVIDAFGRAVITFEIQVTDGTYNDEAEVTIYITDINDNGPMFSTSLISTGVPEGVPIGTVVDIISATDADYGSNAVLTYSKTSGDPDGLFSIPDDTIGKIVVSGDIDKENGPPNSLYVITFYVTAYDSAGHNDTVPVSVEITDVNDNSPIFNPTFYQVTISEGSTNDELLEVVNATDADSGTNGAITYAIVGGNVNNAFYIKTPSLGDVRVLDASVIDRETLSFYRLIITATDGAFPTSYQRSAVSEFVIHISDINDNTPQFLHTVHRGTIPENADNNTFIAVSPSVYATDRDIGSNAAITYDIEAGYPFRIDPNTGFVYTSEVGVLDRETISSYNLTVHARDGGGRETTGLLLITVTDINDNPPIINEDPLALAVTIPENYTVGGDIAQITASDKDEGVNSQLVFSLTGGEGYFQVDPNNGSVTLSQTLIHIERRSDFIVTVRVNDGGNPSYSTHVSFHISVSDVNDNTPVFTHAPASFTKQENSPYPVILPLTPGLWTPNVVTDADLGLNAQFNFFLSANSSPVFSFDNYTGILTLISPLDYESKTLYTALIYVRDRGSPSLQAQDTLSIRLSVTDANDQPPVFDNRAYSTNVSEFTQSNVPLLLVSATDADTAPYAVITYHLLSSSPGLGHDLFKIDSTSGLILTKSYLSETSKGCYDLLIEARNPDEPLLNDNATVDICITDQNQSPQFSQSFYNFSINENTPAGHVLGVISATDPDEGSNSVVSYTLITDPNDNGLFAINSNTGVLSTLSPLDREDQSLHILTVIAQDMGQSGFQHTNYTTILVNVNDVNDNDPQFLHNTFDQEYTISEGVSRNTTIATIQASDVDVGNVNLFNIINDPRSLFKIGHNTGLLQTEGGPEDFDRETFSSYTIIIQVYNADNVQRNSNASITFILTDVNDNTPYFTHTLNDTCIYENSPTGLVIGTYTAHDIDIGINSKVFFQITDGNDGDAFSIEALDGSLKVLNQLDYEDGVTDFTLTIRVQDLGTPSFFNETSINICILDVNDNGPSFTQSSVDPVSIMENQQDGQFIATFEVTDLDSPPYDEAVIRIVSGNELDAFYFNESSNSLFVKNGSFFDYESGNNTFTLTVVAEDIHNPAFNDTALVTITITDANDNPPVLDVNFLDISLLESETVGAILGQLVATDADTGSNAQVSYAIKSQNGNKFSIDPVTGLITLTDGLDYETPPNQYEIIITVTDHGVPPLSATASVRVNVTDINDNPPTIDPPIIVKDYYIPENATHGHFILDVNATDPDTGLGGVLSYEFSNGFSTYGDPPLFAIDSVTGDIILVGSLDYESTIIYEVTGVVKDGGNPQFQDSFSFTVHVTDINDHIPTFKTPIYSNYDLFEDQVTGPNNPFTHLNGTDIDASDANKLYFYAVSDDGYAVPNCVGAFCVSRNGNVYNHRSLDREIEDTHTLRVTVSNSMSTDKSNKTVTDLNLPTQVLTITILDVNDNAPQFISFETKVGIDDNAAIGTRLLTIQTSDADVGDFAKVWYRIEGHGAAVTIDREIGVINTAGSFFNEAGRRYTATVEAYDNEGRLPFNTNSISILFYVYDYRDNSIILQVNQTVSYVLQNLAEYRRIIQNATGGQVVITDVRPSINTVTGQVDYSKTDIVFIVIDSNTDTPSPGSEIIEIFNQPGTNVSLPGINGTPVITVPAPPLVTTTGYDLWLIILIIAAMGSVILLLCCAFCVFLISEKRRRRKLKEEKSELNGKYIQVK